MAALEVGTRFVLYLMVHRMWSHLLYAELISHSAFFISLLQCMPSLQFPKYVIHFSSHILFAISILNMLLYLKNVCDAI